MKKIIFASALVAGLGMLGSCSNDDVVAVGGGMPGISGNDLIPVELGVNGPSVSVQKRGIGTVGDMAENDSNIWRGETLYLLMMERSVRNGAGDADIIKWDFSKWSYLPDGQDDEEDNYTQVVNFANVAVLTPDQRLPQFADSKALTWLSETTPKYYPNSGTHDFFAYHIDDAGLNSNALVDSVRVEDGDTLAYAKYVQFTIDGTQDLMNGMAENMQGEPDAQTNAGFSAQTARAGVTPNINMRHLLTRFTFTVQGADATAQNITVEKIQIVSKNTGKMLVAYDASREAVKMDSLLFMPAMDTLQVKGRLWGNSTMDIEPEVTIDSVAAENDGQGFEKQVFGHAIMVAPGEESYTMFVTLKQTFDVTNPDYTEDADDTQDPIGSTTLERKIVINNAQGIEQADAVAQPGSSYAVNVKVYGMAKIEVDATLQGWEDGGDIEVDTNVQ